MTDLYTHQVKSLLAAGFTDDQVDILIELFAPRKEKAKSKRFVPPTINEIHAYMLEKFKNIHRSEATKFCNFYESKNWMVGKNKMSKWKSSVALWMNRVEESNQSQMQLGSVRDTSGHDNSICPGCHSHLSSTHHIESCHATAQ